MYKAYECNKCGIVFIIPIEYINMIEIQGRYISCPAGHKNIDEIGKYDGIKECMDNHVYVRKGRRIKQIK